MMKKPFRWAKRILLALAALVLLVVGACALVLCSTYPASPEALAAIMSTDTVQVEKRAEGGYAFIPRQPVRGLIFYPGATVEAEAYAPLMQRLAQDGTLCILLDPPFDFALLGGRLPRGVQDAYPQVTEWYIGGHSLGGLVAGAYADRHAEDYDGVLLLASYSGGDLSDTDLRVATVYGDADQVLNRQRYEKGLSLLPDDYRETVVSGGCHSFFADYGMQKKDGEPTVTREEQIEQTAQAFLAITK